ncbi:MAG: transporter of the superfamily [Modestobacter sp.]|jgi:DHA1 family inner membrane transport protein|nr:transporter of the superfamily [Modestobacter sp.]
MKGQIVASTERDVAPQGAPASLSEQVRSNRLSVVMFATLLLSYVVNAADRQLYPVIAPDIREQFGFSLPQSGFLVTVFTLGMGLAGIPTGILLARSSRRFVVYVGLMIFSAATLLTAFAVGFWDLLAYRFASGLGEAMQLTALLAIATGYFVKRRAMAVGALNFTFGVGALIGPNVGAALATSGDWRTPLIVFGIAGFVVLGVVSVAVRPWLTEARATAAETSALEDFGAASLASRNPILLGASTALAGLAMYAYLGLYPTYLREELGFTAGEAGFSLSMYGLGAFFSLAGGWLGDRFDFRRVLASGMVVAAVVAWLLFGGIDNHALQNVLSFLFGASVSGVVYANLAAGCIRVMKRSAGGRGSGLFVASLYIPAAFAGYITGVLVEWVGWTGAGSVQLSVLLVASAVLVMLVRQPAEGRL